MKISFENYQRLQKLQSLTGKKEPMTGCHIETDGEILSVTATDAYAVLRRRVRLEEGSAGVFDERFTVKLPKLPKADSVDIVKPGKCVSFKTESKSSSSVVEESVIEGTYPSLDKFETYYSKKKPSFKIKVNPAEIKKLMSAIGNEPDIDLYFYDKHDPIVIKFSQGEGLICPMRANW